MIFKGKFDATCRNHSGTGYIPSSQVTSLVLPRQGPGASCPCGKGVCSLSRMTKPLWGFVVFMNSRNFPLLAGHCHVGARQRLAQQKATHWVAPTFQATVTL